MIVLGHALTHGNAAAKMENNLSVYLVQLLKTFTVPGTDIFVLISGYFLIHSQTSLKRIIKTWLWMLFYSLSIFIIFACVQEEPFSFSSSIRYSLPASFDQYWFMRVYLYLILCVPFLNILLHHLSKRGHQYLIALGVALMVIPASIPAIAVFNREAGNGILWFIMLYITGAYFAKYPPKYSAAVYAAVAVGMLVLAFASQIVIAKVSLMLGFEGMGTSRFSTFDAFPIYLAACCVLCSGIRWSQKPIQNQLFNKVILFFSSSTAGVYMIHEHPLIRRLLWERLNLADYSAIYAILTAMIIFIVCTLIDHFTWKKIWLLLDRVNTKRIDRLLQSALDEK